jgi:CubicO group peptidase (beta-lactamase class C family)
MLKNTALFAFLTLGILSCKQSEQGPLLAHNILEAPMVKKDTNMIELPVSLTLNSVSEAYRNITAPKLESFFTNTLGGDEFSGGFLVAKNGVVLYETYRGYANYEKKIPMDARTPMHVASISKVFTSTVILKLVEEGYVELDGKVKTYLPDFPYESTTVRTLLNHRSGLPHYSRFSESVKGWNHKKTLTNREVLDYLKRYRFSLLYKTNTKFNYCNTNYAMLALIIEEVTGSDYAAAMEEWLFRPLGMKDSFVFDYFTQKEIVSQSYKSTKVNYGWDQFDAIYGDKNIYSTPRDLAKFDLATYAPGFLRKDLWQEALNGYSYEKNGVNNYGLGYRMKEFETGQKVVFHNGWWHGNTSSYVTLKKDTVAIIGISNRYTKKVYQSMKLSALFGDYPFELADSE